MNCPECGKEMLCGTMRTGKYLYWTQQKLRFFKSPTDAVELCPVGDDTISVFSPEPFHSFPDTRLCKACGLVIFPCHMIEKNQ